ncbi:hypothetical protein ACXET9_01780 [Brachybacterium sp. DNPG3]
MSTTHGTASTTAPQIAQTAQTAPTAETAPAAPGRSGAAAEVLPRRRVGTVAMGLLILLGVVVAGAAVLPQPRLDGWILGVIGVIGLSLILLIVAVLPRGRRAPDEDVAEGPDDAIEADDAIGADDSLGPDEAAAETADGSAADEQVSGPTA